MTAEILRFPPAGKVATYRTFCARCGEYIERGQRIEASATLGYVHAGCKPRLESIPGGGDPRATVMLDGTYVSLGPGETRPFIEILRGLVGEP